MATIRVQLEPLGKTLTLPSGQPLRESLFPYGVEFPCGGRGQCRNCRVRCTAGDLPITARDQELLPSEALADGWRLACHAAPTRDITLQVEQWDATILSDEAAVPFVPAEGLGVAVDLGTTTIVAQLLDLRTGLVLAVRTALNPQARHGGDLMSRVQYAVADKGHANLVRSVRRQIGKMIRELAEAAQQEPGEINRIVLVGNTVMHHLFCDIDLTPLSAYPFDPVDDGAQRFAAADIGWAFCGEAHVHFAGCMGGFVGSDVLAGVIALQIHQREAVTALVDLGTNGEIVVGNRNGLLCASTAAGPAFEGARISQGMRASTGAISEVDRDGDGFRCSVLGDGEERGICGSGLVDAVAVALEIGHIEPSGRIRGGAEAMPITETVGLTQTDIRELQLAKGAIAAGLRILLEEHGTDAETCPIYIAGAFGNYIDLGSARRIGLLAYPPERIAPAGNTALRGAKVLLLNATGNVEHEQAAARKSEHVSLSAHLRFQEIYVEEMTYPES